MKTDIKNEWIYEQAHNMVWAYLTQAELIALWLMPNNFKPIAGQEFQFQTNPIPSLNLDGVFHCKVLEIVPVEKLIYSWKGGPGDGIFSLDTIVDWTLTPYGNGTKLTLLQTGFKETNLDIFTSMTNGWQKHIQKMMDHLNAEHNDNTKS